MIPLVGALLATDKEPSTSALGDAQCVCQCLNQPPGQKTEFTTCRFVLVEQSSGMGKQLCPSSASFGCDVKRVRLARKLTQKRLDQTTGYSEAYVSRVGAGKLLPRPSEKFTKGRDIAAALQVRAPRVIDALDELDQPRPILHPLTGPL